MTKTLQNQTDPRAEMRRTVKAAFNAAVAVADAIRELKHVPVSTLYAQLVGFMDQPTFNRILDTLKGAGVVRESNRILFWTAATAPGKTPVADALAQCSESEVAS